jgi:DNA-binding protein HU-beta
MVIFYYSIWRTPYFILIFTTFQKKRKNLFNINLLKSYRRILTSAKTYSYYHFTPIINFPNYCEERKPIMIKLDIVNRVAEKTGVPKQKAEQVVDSLFNAMKDALAKGKRIELRGFGVFVVKPRKRGIGRNPRTGTEVPIPAGKTIRFKPGKELQAKAVKK